MDPLATPLPHIKKEFGSGLAEELCMGGRTAAHLGIDTTAITIGAEDIEPGMEELKAAGLTVHRISRGSSNNFSNDYSGKQRKLYLRSRIETPIDKADIIWDTKSFNTVILFPLFHELSEKVLSLFSKSQLVFLDPSGFVRGLGEKNKDGLYPLIPSPWSNIEKFIERVDILKLSHEDLAGIKFTPNTKTDEAKCQQLVGMGFPLVILTRSERPTVVVGKHLKLTKVPALQVHEVDSAGAGETFGVAFVYQYFRTKDPIQSARFANICTGLKVSGQWNP